MSVHAANGNHRAFWRHFARICGGEALEISGGLLVRTGIDGRSWNQLHLDPGAEHEAALERGLTYFAEHGLPWRLYAEEESAAADAFAARLGIPANPLYPVLTRPPGPAGTGDLDVAVVSDEAGLREFLDCVAAVYGFEAALLEPMVNARAFADPAFRFHVGRVDGQVVATSIGIQHEKTIGIYFVGVRPEHRRRGHGQAITAAAIDAAPATALGVLQATPAGLPVYQAMGFGVVSEYRYWNVD